MLRYGTRVDGRCIRPIHGGDGIGSPIPFDLNDASRAILEASNTILPFSFDYLVTVEPPTKVAPKSLEQDPTLASRVDHRTDPNPPNDGISVLPRIDPLGKDGSRRDCAHHFAFPRRSVRKYMILDAGYVHTIETDGCGEETASRK